MKNKKTYNAFALSRIWVKEHDVGGGFIPYVRSGSSMTWTSKSLKAERSVQRFDLGS